MEEAYEVVSAIEEGDDENLREELGDLMLVATIELPSHFCVLREKIAAIYIEKTNLSPLSVEKCFTSQKIS